MKKTLSKALLLVLALTFVFTGLIACTGKLEDKVTGLEEQVNQNTTNDQADADALAELKTLVEKVKATADAAALKTSLDAVVADLEALEGAAATQTKLDEVKAGLEAALAANSTADDETKAQLEEAIEAVEAIANAAATKADLDAAKADLAAAKTALSEAIAAVKATADAAATKAEFEAAKAELEVAKENLEAAIAAVKATADAAATKAELEAATANLESAIAIVKTTADAAATKVELEATKADLEAAKAELEATKAELEAAIEAAKTTADAAATKAELEAAKADLEAAQANLEETLEAVKATADGAATKIDLEAAKADLEAAKTNLGEADATLNNKIDAVKTELEGQIAAVKTELVGQINALSTKLDTEIGNLTVAITLLQNKDAEFAGVIELIKADVEKLKADVETLQGSNFVDNFENATKVLNGKLKVVLAADGKVEKLVAEGDAEWETAVDYSLEAFAELNVIDAALYAPVEIAKFNAKFEDLKFFLGRAVSVEAIIDYFAELDDCKTNMPSLIETLIAQLTEKTKVTTAENDLDEIDATAAMIVDLATNADYADTYNWYVEISAAHDNLVAAAGATGDAETAIEAIGYVKYTSSEALIAAAKAEIENLTTIYFGNAAYTKYYNDDATTIVANYNVYTAAVVRYADLTVAAETKVTIIETALNFDTVRPLWTDKADLDANLAAFEAWLTMNNLDRTNDAESLATMYSANEIALLDKAAAYATAMDAIYSEKDVDGLNALVDILTAKSPILWTDKANESDEYVSAYAELKAAIEGVENYNAIDTNYATMIGAARAAAFQAIVDRHAALDNANTALDALYSDMVNKLNNVTFKDYDAIIELQRAYTEILANVQVVEGDENYNAFAAENDPIALFKALYDEYSVLTAKVREIYDTVTRALADSDTLSLTFGNNIQEYLTHIRDIIALGVTDINLPLPGTDGADEVNLTTLLTNLSKVITIYTGIANEAVNKSNEFTVTLGILNGLKYKDLDNYAAIKSVYDALQLWITTYLGDDAIADIQAVQKYMADTGVYYEFITEAEYDKAVSAYNAAKATYDEAESAWADVKAELEELTGDAKNNIHNIDAYATANNKYLAYINKYYKETLENPVFGETLVYDAFTADKLACEAKKDLADVASAEIKNRIDNLDAVVDYTNYAAVQTEIDAIKSLISIYKTEYCPDLCDECIGDDRQVALAKKDAFAQLYAYAEAKKATNCEALIDEQVLFYAGLLNTDYELSKIGDIETTLTLAKSAIDAAVCVDTGTTDNKCDECDKDIVVAP